MHSTLDVRTEPTAEPPTQTQRSEVEQVPSAHADRHDLFCPEEPPALLPMQMRADEELARRLQQEELAAAGQVDGLLGFGTACLASVKTGLHGSLEVVKRNLGHCRAGWRHGWCTAAAAACRT